MPASAPHPLMTEKELEEISVRGQAIYEARLKSLLEPTYNNRFVAIHLDTETYAVGRSTGEAMRMLRRTHPEGQLFLMKIGSEPEYGLAARILSGEMISGTQK